MNAKTFTGLDEVPPLADDFFEKARYRVGMRDATKAEFAARRASKGKQRVSIMLDADVIAYFKTQADGRGYQTLINAALLESMRGRQLADVVRETIREELRPA
ncbi:MAG: BrnA antitoxin family protein [Zoogloeaceae bacterium]|jgi:uncharacterized protein (DUF4415 family)|nr:BrnA antitoxin family protein [Zoogloeaceae bacterium]